MVGNFAAAFGPACLRFLRPILVVGCGGGSYFGLSFCDTISAVDSGPDNGTDLGILLVLVVTTLSWSTTQA